MTLSAFAKINLGLRILRRRDDGFHDLETVFLRTGWADRLDIEPASKDSMTCSDPSLPVDRGNLCVRAVDAIRSTANISGGGLRIHLDKTLPFGAGLGGGSSDAAMTLRAANELLDAGLNPREVHALAADLGSDVPFFLMESGVALGTGRGEVLTPMAFPSALVDTWMVIAAPPVHISTAEAFRGIRPDDGEEGHLQDLVSEGSLSDWRSGLINDFEEHLFTSYPRVARLKADLMDAGAGYSAMSGSGSAVFGIFTTERHALDAAQELPPDVRTWVGRSDAGIR